MKVGELVIEVQYSVVTGVESAAGGMARLGYRLS